MIHLPLNGLNLAYAMLPHGPWLNGREQFHKDPSEEHDPTIRASLTQLATDPTQLHLLPAAPPANT